MERINILLVDDEALIREGLRSLLEKEPFVDKIYEAGDAEQFHRHLSDNRMPEADCMPPGRGSFDFPRLFSTLEAAGYPGVFAHGMLTMGMTGKMLTNYVGDGRWWYWYVEALLQVLVVHWAPLQGFFTTTSLAKLVSAANCEVVRIDTRDFIEPHATGVHRAVIKTIDLVGVSTESWRDAAHKALDEATKTLRNVEGFTVLDTSAVVEGTEIAEAALDGAQVLLTLGTPLEEGVVYTLTVSGIPDRFGNVLAEASTRFLLGGGAVPGPGQLVITEIMYDLPSARNAEEYVELYNPSDVPFDLSALTLSDTGSPGALVGAPVVLLPGEYVAVAADAATFRARFPEAENVVQAGRFPSLNNAGDAVVVRAEGTVIDSVFYSSDWQRPELDSATGIALERINLEGPSDDPANWTSSLAPSGGTPGAPNSVYLPPGESPAAPGLVADPSPFNASIGTQISYTLAADAALVRLRIYDGAGRLVRTLEDAALGGSTRTGTLTWQGRDDDNRPLRIGIYILLLEALDVQGGRTEVYKKVVVLGRDL